MREHEVWEMGVGVEHYFHTFMHSCWAGMIGNPIFPFLYSCPTGSNHSSAFSLGHG